MTALLSFPFRLSPLGNIVTSDDGSDDCYTEELALLFLTKPGERTLVPLFGLNDPTYGDVDQFEVQIAVENFGPPVRVTNVVGQYVNDSTQQITVSWDAGIAEFEDNVSFDETSGELL